MNFACPVPSSLRAYHEHTPRPYSHDALHRTQTTPPGWTSPHNLAGLLTLPTAKQTSTRTSISGTLQTGTHTYNIETAPVLPPFHPNPSFLTNSCPSAAAPPLLPGQPNALGCTSHRTGTSIVLVRHFLRLLSLPSLLIIKRPACVAWTAFTYTAQYCPS